MHIQNAWLWESNPQQIHVLLHNIIKYDYYIEKKQEK